ncbi:MAG: phosphoglucosamine mutase [Rhodothermaceae bacterium]|nr:phosphoglucosamine mutase [Rhodothermaceae bacterium]
MKAKGTLMVTISGIRGIFGNGLDPSVIVRYSSAFGTWCARRAKEKRQRPVVVVGRDARVTGEICAQLVTATLQSTGCDVLDVGLATTPTVAMAVMEEKALGGVILSASHNPAQWNALKLIGTDGEFLRAHEAEEMLQIASENAQEIVSYDQLGAYQHEHYLFKHIQAILKLDYINANAIAERDFRVIVDGINSVGGIAIPALLEDLGVKRENISVLNGEPNGLFAHNPEPLPGHLEGIIQAVKNQGADLGIVVDPDADRLALVADGGRYVSEELTQVIAADFVLRHRKGPLVTNLSSSRALEDIGAHYGVPVHRSAVGEINVVDKMKEVGAVLGGEGSGGVIVPELHYGRDALIGTAMVLQHLTNLGISLSELESTMPKYVMTKGKIPLGDIDADAALQTLKENYQGERISTVDGLKIDFEDGWVHLRKSNTEPIARIYTEARTLERAQELAKRFDAEVKELA